MLGYYFFLFSQSFLLVISAQCVIVIVLLYGTYIFLSWMSSKLSGKDIQNSFANPTAFGESRESKIVRVDFPQIWKYCNFEYILENNVIMGLL